MLTYSSYLKLDELLSLQQPMSEGAAHDEMLFIVVHQTYELWFKEILHEADRLGELLEKGDAPGTQRALKRIRAILRIMTTQMEVLETMTPPEFLSFRGLLGTASGFQSFQFRELEFMLGKKQKSVMERFPRGSEAGRRLQARYTRPTLWDAFLRFLLSYGHAVPRELLERDVTLPPEPSPDLRRIFLDVYLGDPTVANVCEALLDFDEGFQEWRYRHVKMVERMIGRKPGTGGSSGVDYLAETLFKPAFPDLWLARTEFALPAMSAYGA